MCVEADISSMMSFIAEHSDVYSSDVHIAPPPVDRYRYGTEQQTERSKADIDQTYTHQRGEIYNGF